MGGSSKQTIGYKYLAGLMVVIGNPIEKFLGINADNRGWILLDNDDQDGLDKTQMIIDKPNLFGGGNQEGGWVGAIDIHFGRDNQEQNEYLAKNIDPEISAYPNLSYMVFKGYDPITQSQNLNKGFEVVSMSGMLKDFMLWVKRTRIKNDGNRQWFEYYQQEESKIIVCEIGGRFVSEESPDFDGGPFDAKVKSFNHDVYNGNDSEYIGADHNIHFINYNLEFIFNNVVSGTLHSQFINPPSGVDISQRVEFSGFKKGYVIASFKVSTFGKRKISFFGDMLSILSEHSIDEDGNNPAITEYSVLFSSGQNFGININTTDYYKNGDNYFFSNSCLSSLSKPFEIANYYKETHAPDINPIHKIREIITDYTAMGKPESSINDVNFMDAAIRIWNESLGISWCIQEKSCKDALDELLYHIEAGLRINRQTGLYEVILFRDDLIDLDESLSFNESNIKSINFDIANLDESISSINVSYYDRDLIKDSSFLLYENGLERTRGFSISENIDFPYFMNRRNAELVGNWKLKQLSSSTWKGSFKTGVIEARKINKYDIVKLSWKSKGLINLPVRILNINLGDGVNNTIILDFIEVIPYSNINYTETNVDPSIDENLSPQFNSNIAIEMPYFEAVQRFTQTQVDLELSNSPEIGYLMASAARPQNNSLNAYLYTDKATGIYTNMEKVGVVDYCPAIYLSDSIGYLDTILKITNLDVVLSNKVPAFSGATKGTWLLLNDEIMVYESFNSETMEITVKRGALDTIPHKHDSGIIFFSDEFSGIDQNQYVQGENVQYQVLTTTPSSISRLELGDSKFTEFNSRAIRPYPPANIKINDEYYPDEIETDLIVTWVDRNRLQQTGGNIIGWYDENITIEAETSTILIISEEDDNHVVVATHNNNVTGTSSYTFPISTIDPNTRYLNILAKTSRNGFDSYQEFEHNVEISLFFSAPYDIEYTVSES